MTTGTAHSSSGWLLAGTIFWGCIVQAAFAATYDVREFGAVGDGIANDAPAINRALSVPERPLTVRISICGGIWDGNAYDGHNVKHPDPCPCLK